MSAVDKLHKLYASTSDPVVWARSVGLEVINEFDTIKAAIMMDAGASASSSRDSQRGWEAAAKAVQTVTAGLGTASFLRQGVVGAAQVAIQNLLKSSRGAS